DSSAPGRRTPDLSSSSGVWSASGRLRRSRPPPDPPEKLRRAGPGVVSGIRDRNAASRGTRGGERNGEGGVMGDGRRRAVLGSIERLFRAGTASGLSDGQLLERFATRHDEAAEAAFAALVERHGPMVLRVCRRVLNDPHDAQDAFQATFLVLVRKPGEVRNRTSLASWLYGVALRVAAHTRAQTARRGAA